VTVIEQEAPTKTDTFSADAQEFADTLDGKVQELLHSVEETEVYRLVSAPETDPRLVALIVKYILLEVFAYGPHVTEATFTAIGRFPKDRPDLMKPLILHDLSEVDHGEMALRDFIKLGGNEAWARTRKISPCSFAMGATCRMLGERESPFAFLGYMYPFETLTPILTERAQGFLKMHGFPVEAQVFIDTHAEEDIGHANLLNLLVKRVVNDFPSTKEDILYGFDCFTHVYPTPIWAQALENARTELSGRQPK